jgi:hypothetical protein
MGVRSVRRQRAMVCPIVMAGPDPAIHVFFATGHEEDVDARDKRGHDGVN